MHNLLEKVTVLMLPGYQNSGPQHWQSLWEQQYPTIIRVQQQSWDMPNCSDWLTTLDQYIKRSPKPVILVGHSCGSTTIAHWGKNHANHSGVVAALLVAPADSDRDTLPDHIIGFNPMPLTKLSFLSTVVASSNDPYLDLERAKLFAHEWGSEFINIGDCGHINTTSGHGEWREGQQILTDLIKKAVNI